MLIDKRDKETGKIIRSRYYYKCETVGCRTEGCSARAGLVIDTALQFFRHHLFITKENFTYFVKEAEREAARKSEEFDSIIAGSKTKIALKQKAYEQTKELILKNPELKGHYDLDNYSEEIEKIKQEFERAKKQRSNIKQAIPTFEEYLKLFESTPVIFKQNS